MKRKHVYFSIITVSLLLASVTTPVKDFISLLSAKADGTEDMYLLPEYASMPLFVRVEYHDIRPSEDVVSVPYNRMVSYGFSSSPSFSVTTQVSNAVCCEKVPDYSKKCDHNQTREDDQGLAACQQHYSNPSANLLLN